MSLPSANEVWGKVMFLHVSVILFTGEGICLQGDLNTVMGACLQGRLGRSPPPTRKATDTHLQTERKTTHWDYLSPTFLPEKKGNNHFLSIVFSKKNLIIIILALAQATKMVWKIMWP